MRARVPVLFALLSLSALLWMSPKTQTVFAQQPARGQGAQGGGGRGGRGGGGFGGAPGGAGFGRAGTPTFAGPPAGMQALPTDLFSSKNFYKDQKVVVRPALFPLQYAAPVDRHLDLASHRRQAAAFRCLGRLQAGLCLANRSSARILIRRLRSITKPCWPRRRPRAGRPSTPRHTARLGWLLRAGRPRRSWRRVDLGHGESGPHHSLAARRPNIRSAWCR